MCLQSIRSPDYMDKKCRYLMPSNGNIYLGITLNLSYKNGVQILKI